MCMYMYLILHYMSFISGTYHKPHIYIIYIYIYLHNLERGLTRYEVNPLQFKRGELIKFRKRGGQKLLSKHVQRVKKTFRAPESFFVPIKSEKIEN